MTTEEIVNKLIRGETIFITDDYQLKEVRDSIREIKKNCTIVLSQINNRL